MLLKENVGRYFFFFGTRQAKRVKDIPKPQTKKGKKKKYFRIENRNKTHMTFYLNVRNQKAKRFAYNKNVLPVYIYCIKLLAQCNIFTKMYSILISEIYFKQEFFFFKTRRECQNVAVNKIRYVELFFFKHRKHSQQRLSIFIRTSS